jgi:hypothetical protein
MGYDGAVAVALVQTSSRCYLELGKEFQTASRLREWRFEIVASICAKAEAEVLDQISK